MRLKTNPMRPGIGKAGEGRRPSRDLMGQPSCKRHTQRERRSLTLLSAPGEDGLSLLMPDRVSVSGWSLNPHGRDATVTVTEETPPSLCGVARLTEGIGMTSRDSSPLHRAWSASGSWGRTVGRWLFGGASGVNAEMGKAQLLFGQILVHPGRQVLSRREGPRIP